MEQRLPLMDLYAKLPKEKNLAYLEFEIHQIIDQLTEEAEGLRKYQSFFDLDKAVDEPLEDDEMDYCADVVLDMKLEDIPGLSREVRYQIETHAANMLRERLEKLKNDLEWAMTKAASDAIKACKKDGD